MKEIKNNEITTEAVAKYFLSKKSMTQKKLQKMVYYAYAWFIALNNDDPNNITERLFEERPEAWIHGPVFPSLYQIYNEYGWSEIPKAEKIKFESTELQAFLDVIFKKFGSFSANQLEAMTHADSPWREARNGIPSSEPSNQQLSDKAIFIYYNGLTKK